MDIELEPQEAWSLEELGEYIQSNLRRSVKDNWKLGKALTLVRQKLKDERGYHAHIKMLGVSAPTAWRCTEMVKRFTLDEVENQTLSEIYTVIEALRRQERENDSDPDEGTSSPDDDVAGSDQKDVNGDDAPDAVVGDGKNEEANPEDEGYLGPSWEARDETPSDDLDKTINDLDARLRNVVTDQEDWSWWNDEYRQLVIQKLSALRKRIDESLLVLDGTDITFTPSK